MRVIALVSGGKDSCYNMMQCAAEGHEIVALANLHPKDRDELDSYMYQTVGHMGIEFLANAMCLPLYRRETKGKSTQTGKHYVPTDNDEVEDLYNLLDECKKDCDAGAVAVGAILSDYQRVRVENVCCRLNLVSLAYLWRRDQTELLQEMIDCHVHAIIIKVAALGLLPDRHLGKSLREIQPHLLKMRDKYGLNVCGEGGEYESFTIDCPLFKKRIVLDEVQTIISSADPVCPVGYINLTKISLQPKEQQIQIHCDVFVKRSLDYISDLNESTYSDLSDPDLSETELELIEKETRMRESLSQNELMSRSNSFGRHFANNTSSSPIPIVTKSSSVDEPTSSFTTSSLSVAANVMTASASLQATGTVNSRMLKSCSNNAVPARGSLSLTVSSTGATAGLGSVSGATILQPLSPMKYEREFRPLNNRPMAAINRKGWMWVAGIQGCAPTLEEGMQAALDALISIAVEHNYDLTDYCYITLYVRSISEYAILNRIYGQAIHFQNPPTRVCVECPLPADCHVVMEAIAFRAPARRRPTLNAMLSNEADGKLDEQHNSVVSSSDALLAAVLAKRNTMHVQSISHWAPANIGPYSQSTQVGEITYISGQIGLVPGSMTIVEGGIRPQCKLALRHISRIAKAMNTQGQLRDVVHGICFVTHPTFIAEARRQWERRTTNAIMDYIVVPALPRDALVEWQVWAHTHNDRFDYEETGCSVSDYTISIRRRWNYENNCAAIVCYVSTGLASSTTQLTQLSEDILNNHVHRAQNLNGEHIDEILSYILNRLLKDYKITKRIVATNVVVQQSNNNGNSSVGVDGGGEQRKPTTVTLPKTTTTVPINSSSNIPAIYIKVFYQVNASPGAELLINALSEFRAKCAETANVVFTVMPACSLHNFSTFLSICGVRHE